jgi:hypothetical protein
MRFEVEFASRKRGGRRLSTLRWILLNPGKYGNSMQGRRFGVRRGSGKMSACPAPAFASQARPGIEETLWRDMESAPNLHASDRIPSPRATRPRSLGIYERPAATPTTGTGIIPCPRSPNGVIHVVSRPVSEETDVSGASTVVGSGSPTPGGAGDNTPTREGARMINWSLPTYSDRLWPAHLM